MSIDEFDWRAFRDLVGELEGLLDSPDCARESFEFRAVRLLSRLYALGVEMRACGDVYMQTGGDAQWLHRDSERNHEYDLWLRRWQRRAGDMVPLLGDHNTNSVRVDPEHVQGDGESCLSDDMSDVLTDLMRGATLFDQDRLPEAMWEWSFGFDHWGDHAARAVKILHGHVEWGWDWADPEPCA